MSHAYQAPGAYIGNPNDSDTAVTTVGAAIPMWTTGVNGWTFHNVWTGTPTMTLQFYASNDPRAATGHKNNGDAVWSEITLDLDFDNPAGAPGDNMVIITNSRFGFFRMDATLDSGTGTFTCFTCSHGAG